MKFKRIDTETVRCLISEEELSENGLVLDDFFNNKGKTEEFVRRVIAMAEQEVDYITDSTVCNVMKKTKLNRGL